MTKEAKTRSGIPLKAFYEKEGGDDGGLGAPGTFPYTRGRYAQTRSGGSWIQRELSGEGSPAQSNELMRYLLELGQTGVDIIGDAPTMSMMDPDHPLSIPTAGTQGVSACCKQDYLELLEDIPITETSVSSSIPAVFSIAGLIHAARHTNSAPEKLRGSTIQVPLYQEDCSYRIHLPVNFRSRLSADCVEYCADKLPRFHVFLEDTYYFSESGLNGVEEMALGFVEIRHLIRLLLSRGIDVDTFAPRIAILLNCSMDFFEEIAKIRATRRLFARMMRDEFGAKDERSQSVVITSHTSGLSLTAQQPVNNIMRGTMQSLSLVLAGVQAIEISAFDEALRTPSRESHLVSLRTQQVIDLESGVTKVADPLGGSYYVEALTDEIEKRIWDMVLDIESRGDIEDLVDQGYFKDIFHGVMERHSQNIASGDDLVVGVNVHQMSAEDDTMLRDLTDSKFPPCKDHIERIKAYKEGRDQKRLKAGLEPIVEAAKPGSGNLFALTIDAFEAGATMGEVSGSFRVGCGEAYDPHGQMEAVI
ncbi:MAG: acyl-CoA mutase large subunit family protein [Alphaproteobacteria bacterium]|nr:acyl-CoA mutase large subunit family protein [Alphaproteobacteria bacterium]